MSDDMNYDYESVETIGSDGYNHGETKGSDGYNYSEAKGSGGYNYSEAKGSDSFDYGEAIEEPVYFTEDNLIEYPGKENLCLGFGIGSTVCGIALDFLGLIPFVSFYIGLYTAWIPIGLSIACFIMGGFVRKKASKHTAKLNVGTILGIVGLILTIASFIIGIFSIIAWCDSCPD